MDIEFDPADQRFHVAVDGAEAHLHYILLDDRNTMNIVGTYVPPEARGKGVGRELVEAARRLADDKGWALQATCWYARKVLAEDDQS